MKNERIDKIIAILQKNSGISAQDVLNLLPKKVSKITLLRDLDQLVQSGTVERIGSARATKYSLSTKGKIRREYDLDKYFQSERSIYGFNFEIFQGLRDLFDQDEVEELTRKNKKFQQNFANFPPKVIQKEIERLTVEFSWKSSRIEGNTYSLLDTERLLRYQMPADGHSLEEANMILNHKKAMDFICQNVDFFKTVTVAKIADLHKIIVDKLDVTIGIRKTPVGIIGTDYKPLDNEYQLKEQLEKSCDLINSTAFPLEKALIAVAMISYLQPFEDGNKRTSRLVGNAILLANNFSPLSYKNADEIAYKSALIVFYEQNSLGNFKKIFVEQFFNALEKYF